MNLWTDTSSASYVSECVACFSFFCTVIEKKKNKSGLSGESSRCCARECTAFACPLDLFAAVKAVGTALLGEKRSQSASVDHEPYAESAKWMFVSRKPKMGGMRVISAAMSVKTPLPPCHASITPHCIVTPPPPRVLISHICPSSLSQAVHGDAHRHNGWPLEWKQPQEHINYPSAPSWLNANMHHTPSQGNEIRCKYRYNGAFCCTQITVSTPPPTRRICQLQILRSVFVC